MRSILGTVPKSSYANVMATIAVFIALGGTAYAAVVVTGKNVRNGTLTGADLRNNSVTGVDVKNGTLQAGDFKRGQVPAGPPGAPGAAGAKGDTGPGSAAKGVHVDGAAQPVTLKPGDDWTTVAQLQTTTTKAGLFTFNGAVEEKSIANVNAAVELRIVHNGHAHPLASGATIAPGEAAVGLAFFVCNESPGAHDVQLQAQATGGQVTVGDRDFALAETVHLP